MSLFSLLRHRTFLSASFDMAFYIQDVWAIGHGWWVNTIAGFHVFADHFSPVLVILSPFAYLPTAESLLVLQGMAVGAGLIPAYRLGWNHGGHRYGLLVATWYGASAAIWHAVMFDFHPVTLGVPLLMWLIAEVDAGKEIGRLVLIAVALALIREDMAVLAGVVLCQAALLRRKPRLAGAGLGVAAIGFGYIAWVSAWSGGMGGYHLWTRFGQATSSLSPIDVLVGIGNNLLRPDSLISLTALLAPLLILPPLRGWRWSWPGLGILVFNCISSYAPQAALYYQYFAPAVPFLVWGAAKAFPKAEAAKDRFRLALLATASLFVLLGPIFYLGFGLPDRFVSTSLTSLDRIELGELLSVIPPAASVSASDHILPQVASRKEAFPFPGPMQCSQSLIFHVSETSYTDYVAVEWDSFSSDEDIASVISSWGYTIVSENAVAGVWVLENERSGSERCPSVAEEREMFSRSPRGGS